MSEVVPALNSHQNTRVLREAKGYCSCGSFIPPASKGNQLLSEGCDGFHHVWEEQTAKSLQIKHALAAGEFMHVATYLGLKRETEKAVF